MDTTVATNTATPTSTGSSRFTVRAARRDDMDDLLLMIQELADFEKMSGGPQLTVEDLIRDGGFNSDTAHPLFVCFVAQEEPAVNDQSPLPLLGYAIAFVGYSTWTGRSLQMKDFYVREAARRLGVGRALFRAIGGHAYRAGFGRLDYHVLNWNERAIAFYKAMGAVDLTEAEEWTVYRLAV